MSTYKLYYFNTRGGAEVSRSIFAVASQKFEDIRHEYGEESIHKAETPLGHMPVLEFDGVKLPQSVSTTRFLAKQFNLAGKDNFEQAKVDAVVDTITDLVANIVPSCKEQDPIKKQAIMKKFLNEDLPKYSQDLEVLGKLYGNGGPFFVGNQLTWADLVFFNYGEIFLALDEDWLNDYPWLKQNRAEVEKQPRIAEYLKNRSKTA